MSNQFGKIVRDARKKMNLSQTQLGAPLGLKHWHISEIETGKKSPNGVTDELCKMLGLDPKEMPNYRPVKRKSQAKKAPAGQNQFASKREDFYFECLAEALQENDREFAKRAMKKILGVS